MHGNSLPHLKRFVFVFALAAFASTPCIAVDIPPPKYPANTTNLYSMKAGTLAVDAKNKELISELSKWLCDRLVHPPFNGEEVKKKVPGRPEDLETLMEEFEKWSTVPNPRNPPNDIQLEYFRELGKEMSSELLFVMNNTVKPLEKVNAARMLAQCGKLPCPELADVYLKILREDKFTPPIKLFALQGLRNLLAHSDHLDPTSHIIRATKDRNPLLEINNELEKIILKQYPMVSLEDANVIRYFRREAVRAMANFKSCVIYSPQKEIVAKPIWTLLRVARNDPSLLPTYNFHPMEQIEALIGICSMRPDKNINVDAVAYLVNESLLEMVDFQGKEKGAYLKDNRHKPIVPWKLMGTRLNDAMKRWKVNVEKVPADRGPKAAIDLSEAASTKVLNKLEVDGINAQPDVRAFLNWRIDRKPKTPQIVVGDKTTEINVQ